MDLQFGAYRLNRQERLVSGPSGPVELTGRSFDILETLLLRPDEVVSKDALMAAVWPGVIVEENALHVHMSALRKLLGPTMIATVHGRGYKYAGPPPVETNSAAIWEKPDRKPAVAVLPFDNLSGDPEQQYFSDGITGDIIDRMVRFRVFSVIGQHSAASFRDSAPDFVAIRERLKVDFVVTGSVRRAGGRIRIAVRLLDALKEKVIWAEHYDRPIDDLFSLQDEISELVASAIARYLEVEINVRSSGQAYASLSSYEHMLQGYWHFKKVTRAGMMAAKQCFERAVALDPRNAEALAWLGATYRMGWDLDFNADDAVRGVEFTNQSITLDPVNARCHAIHAWALTTVRGLEEASRMSARGILLNSGDPNVLANRALILVYEGKCGEARELLGQARKLEPLPPLWFGEFEGIAAFAEGRYEECLGCRTDSRNRVGCDVRARLLWTSGLEGQGYGGAPAYRAFESLD